LAITHGHHSKQISGRAAPARIALEKAPAVAKAAIPEAHFAVLRERRLRNGGSADALALTLAEPVSGPSIRANFGGRIVIHRLRWLDASDLQCLCIGGPTLGSSKHRSDGRNAVPLNLSDKLNLNNLHLLIEDDQDKKIEHLIKVVRILWQQVEHLESQISASKDRILLKTGSASFEMKADGNIEIKGNNIEIKGSGRVDIKGAKVT
jgi:hypothetical protein